VRKTKFQEALGSCQSTHYLGRVMATHSEIALVNLQTATGWRGETGWLAFEHLEPITITK